MEEENEAVVGISPQGGKNPIDFEKLYQQSVEQGKRRSDSAGSGKVYNAPKLGDSQYDKDIKLDAQIDFGALYNKSLEQNRALLQPNIDKFGNSIAQLINIVFEAIGGIAAAVDFEDYFNSNDEVGNWVTTITNDWKKATNETFPIYRVDRETPMDFSDSGWWFENGTSLVQSIGGFAITGGVVSKSLEGLSKVAKLQKISNSLLGASKTEVLGESAQTLTTALALNQAEAILEAGEVYTEIYNLEFAKLKDSGKSEDEIKQLARQKAADAASITVNTNRLNILLNLSSANLFIKLPSSTRNILTKKNIGSSFKRSVLEGGQESAEEVINFVASQRGKAFGKDKDYDMKALYNDITSPQAAEAALLGFLGGMGQTIITTEGVNRIKKTTDPETGEKISVRNYNKLVYNRQKEQIEKINSLKKTSNVKDFTDIYNSFTDQQLINSQLEKAIKDNDTDKIELLQKLSLDRQALESFKAGTTSSLISLYQELGNGDQKEGMGDDYKKRSQQAINRIEKLEKIYNKVSNEVNSSQLYTNRALLYNYEDQIDKINSELNEKELELESKKNRLVNITKNENLRKEHVKYLTKGDPLNEEIENLRNQLEEKSEIINDLNNEYKTINSSKYKKRYIAELDTQKEEVEEELESQSEEVEEAYNQEVQEEENQKVEDSIKEDLKQEEEEKEELETVKEKSNTAYRALEELINNSDDYGLENVPNGTSVFANGLNDIHMPVLQNLEGFEDVKPTDIILLTPTSKGIEVKIGYKDTGKEVNFLVNQYNTVKKDSVTNDVNLESVNNNDTPLLNDDNISESKTFESQQEINLNKAKDASLVNAYNSDYTSDNYQEYVETPRNKVGEEVTFDIGINESTGNTSNQSEISKLEAERQAELDKIEHAITVKSVTYKFKDDYEGGDGTVTEVRVDTKKDGSVHVLTYFEGEIVNREIIRNKERIADTLGLIGGKGKVFLKNEDGTFGEYKSVESTIIEETENTNIPTLKKVDEINTKYDTKIAKIEAGNNYTKGINSVVAQDAISLLNSVIEGNMSLSDDQLKQLILNLPIKVNLTSDVFTHLPFESELSNVSLTDAEYNARKNIITEIIKNKSFNGITSKIKFQYPGIVKQDLVEGKPANNSILELPSINNDLSKLEFFISDSNGNILNLDNKPNDSFGRSKHAGNIFIKVPTANGKNFPLKLNIRRVNKPEVDILLRVTEALLDPSKPIKFNSNIDTVLNLINFTPQELEAVKQEAKILGKNLKNLKVIELINSIVYEGNSDKNKYKISQNNLTYGSNTISFDQFQNSKESISNWLLNNKNRNVKKAKLKEKAYKEFFANNVLFTDAKLGEATFGGNTKIYIDTSVDNKSNEGFESPKSDFARLLSFSEQEETANIKQVPDIEVRKNIKNKLKGGSRAALKARKEAAKKNNSNVNDIPSTDDKNKKC